MTTEIFKDKDWSIMTHDYTFSLNYQYYAMHDVCSTSLMDWDHRKCYDCGTVVPDNIQTLMCLLLWDTK